MALVSGRRSTLNPDAPLFIPAAFRQVDDFSPEWWQLVTTSSWYRDYWISQHEGEDGFYDNGENDHDDLDVADLLPESFDFDAGEDFFEPDAAELDLQLEGLSYYPPCDTGLVNDAEAASFMKSIENGSLRASAEPAKYSQKPAKWVNARCTPRNIHQPR